MESPGSGAFSTTALTYLAIATALLWYVWDRYINRHYYELGNQFPGPAALPIVGNGLRLLYETAFASNHRIFQKLYSRSFEYGNVGRMWIGNKLIVFLMDPQDIEVILGSSVHIDKSPEYRMFKPWLGDGLLISSGEKWKAHRKLIAPTFHLNVLKSFLNAFNTNSRDIVNKFNRQVGKEIDCHDYLSECTVDILLESAMGVSKKIHDTSGFEYAKAVMKMCDNLHVRQMKLWLRPAFLFNLTKSGKEEKSLLDTIHSLTNKVIKKKKEDHKNKPIIEKSSIEKVIAQNEENLRNVKSSTQTSEGKFLYGQTEGLKDDLDVEDNDIGEKKRSAFLDFMIECAQNGLVLSEEEVTEEVNTIMFEGHDTTAGASSFFLCLMAAHPKIQEKCVEEVDAIFGDSDRGCTFQDTLEMKYLERCIMETIRLYPPVPIIAREIKQDVPLVSANLTIPAQSTVIIGTFKLHRCPNIYPNPDRFNPDNFLPEKSASRHYYSFIPFSAGPRSCVGRKYAMLKLKVLLSTILRNFRVVGGKKESDWKLQADIILKRTDGFNVKMEPRKRGMRTMESIVAPVDVSPVSSTAVFVYLLIPALLLWYIYHRLSNQHLYELGNKIPGPPGLPVVGNGLEFIGASNHRVFQKLYARSFEYESVARLWIGPRLFVFLTDPRDIELILGSTVHIDKSPEYKFFRPWLGNGLLISTGEKWRAHRKLIAPTFHLNVLKSFIDLFNTNSRDVVAKLQKEAGKEFDCHDYMSECTVEILLETAMGVSKKTQDKSGFDYAMAVMKMCNILHLRQTKLWLRPELFFQLTKYGKEQIQLLDTIHSLTKKVLKRKKEEHLKTKKSILEKTSLEKLIAQDEEKLKEMRTCPL